jgi:flavin-dependent dehydrogenase
MLSVYFRYPSISAMIAAHTAMNYDYDAILIGAGPSGSSAAAILAEYGHRVLVLEREKFPRYHVGESLIPFTFGPLERLGMIPKMKASQFVKKYSVSFVLPDGKRSQPFYFFNRYDRETVAQTWQVLRSEFDEMLVANAREKGAEVREETVVNRLLMDGDRVTGVEATERRTGRIYKVCAPITLDCTGKEAFTSSLLGWRFPDPQLNKIAVWTYYRGSKREPGIDEGQTTVAMIPDKGWFWHIPMHGDMVSVGVVADGKYLTRGGVKEPREIFHREIGENLWIQDHLNVGESTGEYYITSEYTRYSRHCASPGLLLLGDAFAFLDPVFSSGVLLALKCGHLAGEAVHEGLVEGDLSPAHFAPYGDAIRGGIENMRKLVYAFYDPNFSFREVVQRHPEAAGQITDCLSGDVSRDFSQLWDWIREIVPLPEPLRYGEPLHAA